MLFERTNESKIKWWIYSFVYNCDIGYMLFWGINHYLGNDCNIVLNRILILFNKL